MTTDKDKITFSLTDQIKKKDLEIILEVNKKAVEIETEVAGQNEEIIESLSDSKDKQEIMDEKLDKLVKQSDELTKDMFKMQVLYITGMLALVAQIIQIFLKK
jgi:hypothetical protein